MKKLYLAAIVILSFLSLMLISCASETTSADTNTGEGNETQRQDADGDGYFADGTDCNDNDARINPGVTDQCEGDLDMNCDGIITTCSSWYQDADADGYGNSSMFLTEADQPNGYVLDGTDCDDTNPNINPGASEVLNNGQATGV